MNISFFRLRLFFACVFFLFSGLKVVAQLELHIHHINVENGDATMIGIYDAGQGRYVSKVLIDGGMSASSLYLLPYIRKVSGASGDGTHFKYVILTHYHNDHYIGLNSLKTGDITADSLVDPGGYDFTKYFQGQAALAQDAEAAPAKLVVAPQWLDLITKARAHHPAFIGGHSEALVSFGTSNKSGLGRKLVIGEMNGLQVTLECVAGWGNTLNGNGITPDPLPNKPNPNNFSLAFILQCGQFRYFIGGDLGGSDNGLYIDQESALTGFLVHEFPSSHSFGGTVSKAGHICGFKADHHGSNNSNTTGFMQGMWPAVTVTSGGDKTGWFLPQVGYITKLSTVKPLSIWTQHQQGTYNRGVYFTNLYDWDSQHNSLSKAKTLFSTQQDVNFNYGNDNGGKAGYLIRVKSVGLAQQSAFEVDRVDVSQSQPYSVLAQYFCHKP